MTFIKPNVSDTYNNEGFACILETQLKIKISIYNIFKQALPKQHYTKCTITRINIFSFYDLYLFSNNILIILMTGRLFTPKYQILPPICSQNLLFHCILQETSAYNNDLIFKRNSLIWGATTSGLSLCTSCCPVTCTI